jgi:hypothetical protein
MNGNYNYVKLHTVPNQNTNSQIRIEFAVRLGSITMYHVSG